MARKDKEIERIRRSLVHVLRHLANLAEKAEIIEPAKDKDWLPVVGVPVDVEALREAADELERRQ